MRWAYNSWNRNPFETTDFKSQNNWSPGDCFLVYPGNLSSLRFESLRDGLENFEKIAILRERVAHIGTPEAKAALEELETTLCRIFTVTRSRGTAHQQDVLEAHAAVKKAH